MVRRTEPSICYDARRSAPGRFREGSWIMAFGDRKSERVDFEQGIRVYMMGIDGTWRRDCLMVDVSQTGARLTVEGSLEGLDLKEFFLLLSSTGLAYRRCRMVRLVGDQIGIEFLKPATKSRKVVREKRKETLG
jgi:PilZ domain